MWIFSKLSNGVRGAVPRMDNRLINETSPYLLQHAQNPVDWYPWGNDAFNRAKNEDKPILLSSDTDLAASLITLFARIEGPALKLCFFILCYLNKCLFLVAIPFRFFSICHSLN